MKLCAVFGRVIDGDRDSTNTLPYEILVDANDPSKLVEGFIVCRCADNINGLACRDGLNDCGVSGRCWVLSGEQVVFPMVGVWE